MSARKCRRPSSIFAASRKTPALVSGRTQRLGDRVGAIIFRDELFGFRIAYFANETDQIADAVTIHRVAQANLRFDFISLGHCDVAHVVAEARDSQVLRVVPRASRSRPDSDLRLNTGIAPGADDNFSREPHACRNMSILAVTVGRLVKIHEIHVDGGPWDFFVELGMKMQQRLTEKAEAADPHAGRRERVHPGDQADAILGAVGVQTQLIDGFAGGHHWLDYDFYRQGRSGGNASGDSCGMFVDSLEDFVAVEVLAACDEPNFQIRKINHPSSSARCCLLRP